MIYIDVQTGKPLNNVVYQCKFSKIEFFEQFNEYLMIRRENEKFNLFNVIERTSTEVEGFETPEAFFFLYENNLFVCVAEGKIQIYRVTDGRLMTNFCDETVYTKFPIKKVSEEDQTAADNYVVNLTESRKHLLCIHKDEKLVADNVDRSTE